jgi:cationic amino acid transporter 3
LSRVSTHHGRRQLLSELQVGEFVAFIIGWNLTLEHVIGTASLARGYSGYLGSLFADVQLHKSELVANMTAVASLTPPAGPEWAPHFLQSYLVHFDWLAFCLTMLVTGLLLLGVEVSSRFQITFATINLSVACFIFACGLFKADLHNWQLTKQEIPASAGEGGFLPFGWTGVIAGAGTCFFAFVGFDGIAATAEEVKNPRKAIPNSILWTSGIIFITYCGMSTIQTLIWPYWDQKQAAPLPYIFEKLGMHFAKWTILVGVLAGLSTSFVGSFLPLPRILYAMARDGVIYRILSVVSKRFKVPVVATIVGGILIACLASMMDIEQLADMLSIGTLAAYSLVSISVLLLRYEFRETSLPIVNAIKDNNNKCENLNISVNGVLSLGGNLKQELNGSERKCSTASATSGASTSSSSSSGGFQMENGSRQPIGRSSTRSIVSLFIEGTRGPNNQIRRPDAQTTHISRVIILMLTAVTTLLDYSLVVYGPTLYLMEPLAVTICSSLFILTLLLGFLLNRLPTAEPSTNSFEVPLVPTIPVFSVIINTYLMLNLSVMTWIRFAVWMTIGFFIYFTYGIFRSTGYKDSRLD